MGAVDWLKRGWREAGLLWVSDVFGWPEVWKRCGSLPAASKAQSWALQRCSLTLTITGLRLCGGGGCSFDLGVTLGNTMASVSEQTSRRARTNGDGGCLPVTFLKGQRPITPAHPVTGPCQAGASLKRDTCLALHSNATPPHPMSVSYACSGPGSVTGPQLSIYH